MSLLSSLRSFVSTLFQRSQIDADMEEELRSHIQHRADDLERSGLSHAEAERRARVEFGGYERYKAESHEALSGQFFETLLQDIRFGLRMMRKSPGFTVVAVLSLALGIGANAVVFSVLNALILQPINVPHAQSLYMIERGNDRSPQQSYPDYLDLRDQNQSFEGLMAYSITRAGLATHGKASAAWLYEVSGNYFDVLGIEPYLGRFFHSYDEHGPNSSPYIVLSYAYWRSHFQSDRSVAGRPVLLNKHSYTILGVAPIQFRGTELFFAPDFWVPLVDQEQVEGWSNLNSRATRGILAEWAPETGRNPCAGHCRFELYRGSPRKDLSEGRSAIEFFAGASGPDGGLAGTTGASVSCRTDVIGWTDPVAACANLGSLFAARAADRSREIALRLALGSSRERILRQLLTEAILISSIGGATGLLGGLVLLRWLCAWQPIPSFPINLPVNPDANVYAVALLLALASGLLFGIVPIRLVLRANPYQIVKSGSASTAGRRFTVRDGLLGRSDNGLRCVGHIVTGCGEGAGTFAS